MIGVQLDVRVNTAEYAVGAVVEFCRPENLIPLIGESVKATMRDNFYDLDSSKPNRLGGERTHWYRGCADLTDWRQEGTDTVIVSTTQVGAAFRFQGGTITAGKGESCLTASAEDATLGAEREVIHYTSGNKTKYLTIPANAEAYGRRACDIPGLRILWGRSGPYALARVEERLMAHLGSLLEREHGAGGSYQTQHVEIFYFLKESVVIPADPDLLPPVGVISDNLKRDFAQTVKDLTAAVVAEASERGAEEGALQSLNRAVDKARNLRHANP